MNKKKSLSLLGIFIISVLLSCPSVTDETTTILPIGEYFSDYDGIFFDIDNSTFAYYGDMSKNIAYKGKIVKTFSEDKSGYIVIKITDSSSDFGSWKLDYSYFVENTYTVIKWKDLSGDTVKESSPYIDEDSDYKLDSPVSFTSLDLAEETLCDVYADEKYYKIYGNYSKQ